MAKTSKRTGKEPAKFKEYFWSAKILVGQGFSRLHAVFNGENLVWLGFQPPPKIFSVEKKVSFKKASSPLSKARRAVILQQLKKNLNQYIAGQKKDLKILSKLNIEKNLKGTLFQKKVWKTLLKIPSGEVRSYEWVAKNAGYPKAVRAVGSAIGANPICVAIPCHRVLRKNHELGGYAGGLSNKIKLLKIEKVL